MNHRIKRILVILLASLMLLPLLASCGEPDKPQDTAPSQSEADESQAETAVRDELPDGLNYGGNQVNILSRDYGDDLVDELFAEELISDPVNDAIYERNAEVSERLQIKINNMGGFHAQHRFIIESKVNSTTSTYKSLTTRAQRNLTRVIEKLDKLVS